MTVTLAIAYPRRLTNSLAPSTSEPSRAQSPRGSRTQEGDRTGLVTGDGGWHYFHSSRRSPKNNTSRGKALLAGPPEGQLSYLARASLLRECNNVGAPFRGPRRKRGETRGLDRQQTLRSNGSATSAPADAASQNRQGPSPRRKTFLGPRRPREKQEGWQCQGKNTLRYHVSARPWHGVPTHAHRDQNQTHLN